MIEENFFSSLESNTAQPQQQQETLKPLPPAYFEAPPKPSENKNRFSLAAIPKKTCAIEVLKYVKQTKTTSLLSIIGLFTVAAASIFGSVIAAVFSIVFIIPLALMLSKAVKEQTRLTKEYGLEVKK